MTLVSNMNFKLALVYINQIVLVERQSASCIERSLKNKRYFTAASFKQSSGKNSKDLKKIAIKNCSNLSFENDNKLSNLID